MPVSKLLIAYPALGLIVCGASWVYGYRKPLPTPPPHFVAAPQPIPEDSLPVHPTLQRPLDKQGGSYFHTQGHETWMCAAITHYPATGKEPELWEVYSAGVPSRFFRSEKDADLDARTSCHKHGVEWKITEAKP